MLEPKIPDHKALKRKEVEYKQGYTQSHDKRHRVVHLPSLNAGDLVYVCDQGQYGEIVERLNNPRSYKIMMDNGGILTRNRSALLHTGSTAEASPSSTPATTPRTPPMVPPNLPSSNPPQTQKRPQQNSPPSSASSISNSRPSRVIKSTEDPDMIYF